MTMRVAVLGTGYVGLVSGACLAERGHRVRCVDVDEEKVERINRGESPIHEAGLEELLRRNVPDRLRASTDLAAAVRASEVSLVAVGTPFEGERIDLGQVREIARQIGSALGGTSDYHAVVVKSTVVPGTTDQVVRPILEEASGRRAGRDFGVGMNPEFLREGRAVDDFMHPDRIVMGGMDRRTHRTLERLYEPFGGVERVRTSNRTAEMIKYASNALFATMISYTNEIANLCAALGDIDVAEVMRGVHLDHRLSPTLPDGERVRPGLLDYLEAGCGFGGSCFPKDVRALISHGEEAEVPMRILRAVIDVNRSQHGEMIRPLERAFGSLEGVRVAVLGAAFKPGTDDVRESPALPIVRELRSEGASVVLHDPVALPNAHRALGEEGLAYREDLADAVEGAEAILLVTRWPEYAELPELIREARPAPLVVDGRRMLDREDVARYEGIGLRPAGDPRTPVAGG